MIPFDFAIIGSGVSGGRFARDLTESGAKCLLIEAGSAYHRKTFPKNEMDANSKLFWGGGVELSTSARLGFLRARCLGGTSIVNQALLDRFDESAFSDWRDRSGISFFSLSEFSKNYDAVEKQIQTRTLPPEFRNRNAEIFTKAFDQMGYSWAPMHRAQSDCKTEKGSDCIVCLGGCPRDSKQSSLVTGIREAQKIGIEIETDCEVSHIIDHHTHVEIQTFQHGKARSFLARKVVLAGGALGNSQILLRSGFKKELPALGHSFSCHPQYMHYGLFDEPVDAHKGAFQTVKSQDFKLRRSGYKYENVFVGPVGTSMLLSGFGKSYLQKIKKYRFLASMEICVRDEPSGVLTLDRSGRLRIQKELTSQDLKRKKEGTHLLSEMLLSAGAKTLFEEKQGFGLHLMGGCPMGVDAKTSVVDPNFNVHGHPNLIIADSSVFPSAPGINPSFTIMALSHRAAQLAVKR